MYVTTFLLAYCLITARAFQGNSQQRAWGNLATINNKGEVISWGDNIYPYSGDLSGTTRQPSDVTSSTNTGFVKTTKVFSSLEGFVALREDGTIRAWGDKNSGGCMQWLESPSSQWGNTNFCYPTAWKDAQIITDGVHATHQAFMVVKDDGTFTSWSQSGQYHPPSGSASWTIKSVTTAANCFAVIKSDDTIFSWGECAPVDAAWTSTKFKVIYSAQAEFVAVTTDDRIYHWGSPGNYQNCPSTGGGVSKQGYLCAPAQISGVKSIASTQYSFAALKADGTIETWGKTTTGACSGCGQNGCSQPTNACSMTPATTYTNIKTIYSNIANFAALKNDGTLVVWGASKTGGCTGVQNSNNNQICLPDNLSGVTFVAATRLAFAAVVNGNEIVAWGDASEGGGCGSSSLRKVQPKANSNTQQIYCIPKYSSEVSSEADIKLIASNQQGFQALKTDGTGMSWGPKASTTESAFSDPEISNQVDIACSEYSCVSISTAGTGSKGQVWAESGTPLNYWGANNNDLKSKLTDLKASGGLWCSTVYYSDSNSGSGMPSAPTQEPTPQPSAAPTPQPSAAPTVIPTYFPTESPTAAPTPVPSCVPSPVPTGVPSAAPSPGPTLSPTTAPSKQPTPQPSVTPTQQPSAQPSAQPTQAKPSYAPTQEASQAPSLAPVAAADPTMIPSQAPSPQPSIVPTAAAKPTTAPQPQPLSPTQSPVTQSGGSDGNPPSVAPSSGGDNSGKNGDDDGSGALSDAESDAKNAASTSLLVGLAIGMTLLFLAVSGFIWYCMHYRGEGKEGDEGSTPFERWVGANEKGTTERHRSSETTSGGASCGKGRHLSVVSFHDIYADSEVGTELPTVDPAAARREEAVNPLHESDHGYESSEEDQSYLTPPPPPPQQQQRRRSTDMSMPSKQMTANPLHTAPPAAPLTPPAPPPAPVAAPVAAPAPPPAPPAPPAPPPAPVAAPAPPPAPPAPPPAPALLPVVALAAPRPPPEPPQPSTAPVPGTEEYTEKLKVVRSSMTPIPVSRRRASMQTDAMLRAMKNSTAVGADAQQSAMESYREEEGEGEGGEEELHHAQSQSVSW